MSRRLSCVSGVLLSVVILAAAPSADAQRRRPTRRPQPVPPRGPRPARTPGAPVAPPPPGVAELVEAGVSAYESGELEAAVAAFDRAEAAGVDRALFVRILAHRVLIAHASSDASALESEALRLVSLDPQALAGQASPELARALEAAQGRADGIVRVRIEHEVQGGDLRLRARVEGDVSGLVEQVQFRARRGDGPLIEAVNGVITLPGSATDDVLVVTQCVGRGDVVLATLGTMAEPQRLAALIAEEIVDTGPVGQSSSDDTGLHIGLVVGGVAVVAAAVIVSVLVVGASSSSGQLTGPVVEW